MRALWLCLLLWEGGALRIASLGFQIKLQGNMGGINSATSLCIAATRQQAGQNTWIPLLEESPPNLQNKLAAYGPSIYPYTTINGDLVAQSNLFAPGAILATLPNDTQHYTGYGPLGATCNSWTSSGTTLSGAWGTNITGDMFLVNGTNGCNALKTIVCVEVPRLQPMMKPTWLFVTNQSFTANMGGLAGADRLCSQAAAGGSPAIRNSGGRFYALLSTAAIDLRDRPRSALSSGPIYLAGARSLGTSYEILMHTASNPTFMSATPYAYTEILGSLIPAPAFFWTGSTPAGVLSTGTSCGDWKFLGGSGGVGDARSDYTSTFFNSTQLCSTPSRLMCMQYFSPIANAEVNLQNNLSRISVNLTAFPNVVWWHQRCVVSDDYVTDITEFWTLDFLGAEEVGVNAAFLWLPNLTPGIELFLTCALRSVLPDLSLTWLENITSFTLRNNPTVSVTNALMNSLTISVQTNQTSPTNMYVRCVLFTGRNPTDTIDFWTTFPGQTTIATTGSVNFVFPNLTSNSYYMVMCAQYPVAESNVNSSAVVRLNAATLPKCADLVNPCPASTCLNPPDNTAYQCAPYFDGGMALGNTSGLCRSAGGNVSSVTTTKTSGNDTISFCMNAGLRVAWDDITRAQFFYGMPDAPTRFQCNNPRFSTLNTNNTFVVSCQTARGMGYNLRMLLVFASAYIAGIEAVNYPPPVILNSTIRLPDVSNATGSTSVVAPSPDQVVVAFGVQNVELLPELQVFYGNGYLNYPCVLDTRTNSSMVFCRTDIATEYSAGFTFTLNANGQEADGSDILTIPAGRPVVIGLNISAASGCMQDAKSGGVIECPTVGDSLALAQIITVVGTNFGNSSLFAVFVDGVSCPVIGRSTNNGTDKATCRLPPGTGYGKGVFVQAGAFFSAPKFLVSYAAPVLTTVAGCGVPTTAFATVVTSCDRQGGNVLDVYGSNFGKSGANVLIGVSPCSNVIHDNLRPHSHLSCELPPGFGLDRPVLVLQGNGAASLASSVAVSYTQCGPGSFQDSNLTTCALCNAGTFSSTEGLSGCFDCLPGTMNSLNASTTCIDCSPGSHQPFAAMSFCYECIAGTFSANAREIYCAACPAGRFGNDAGSNACEDCPKGTYQDSFGQTNCMNCTQGKYQDSPGRSTCSLCNKGESASAPGFVNCELCVPGTFQADLGGSRCDYCEPGRFANLPGTSDCIPCQAGSISVNFGVVSCDACPKGFAQSSSGQSSCSQCTIGRFAAASGFSSCFLCPLGAISGVGADACMPCPPGSTAADSVCACNPGHQWTGSTCEECVVGQDCSKFGVLSGEAAIALPGFLRVGNESAFQACLVSTYCPGGALRCAAHRGGPLCQVCDDGYRDDTGSPDGSCSACPSVEVSTGNILGVGILLICILMILYYTVVRAGLRLLRTTKATTKKQWWEVSIVESKWTVTPAAAIDAEDDSSAILVNFTPEARAEKTFSYQLKILITFIQLCTSVLTLSTLALPPTFGVFLTAFEFLNLNFIPWNYVGCVSHYSMLVKIIVTAIAPFVLLPVAGFFLFLVLACMDRFDDSDDTKLRNLRVQYRAVFWKVSLFTVFLAYPAVSRQIFSYFRCVEIFQDQAPSIYVLREAFSEVCYDDTWSQYLFVVIALVLVYPVGVPVALGLLLRHYRPRFSDPKVRYCLGFIYEGYATEMWFFELLDMIHKLLVASIVSLLSPTVQVPVAMGILGAYQCLLYHRQPYVRKADNQLHLASQASLYLIVFSFLARDKTGPIPTGSEEDVILSALLIIIFISVLLLSVFRVVQFGRLVYLARKRKARQKALSSRHLGSSSVDHTSGEHSEHST